jgi:hypothetical protein
MGITFASMHGKFEIRLKSEIILILSWLYSLCTLGKGKNNIMAPCKKRAFYFFQLRDQQGTRNHQFQDEYPTS